MITIRKDGAADAGPSLLVAALPLYDRDGLRKEKESNKKRQVDEKAKEERKPEERTNHSR